MKKIIALLLLVLLLVACKTKTLYVPVETLKIEYRDKVYRDSILRHDSIFILVRGDTVWYEKYKTIYRDRLIRDSVHIVDSIRVPYPVIETKEVNRLSSFQSFQLWCGRILLLLLVACVGVRRLMK